MGSWRARGTGRGKARSAKNQEEIDFFFDYEFTPLFFRASILINEKIITYDNFLNMRYLDFKRIEAVYLYKNKMIKTKVNKANNDKVKAQLQGLPTKDFSQYFTKEQIDQLKNI